MGWNDPKALSLSLVAMVGFAVIPSVVLATHDAGSGHDVVLMSSAGPSAALIIECDMQMMRAGTAFIVDGEGQVVEKKGLAKLGLDEDHQANPCVSGKQAFVSYLKSGAVRGVLKNWLRKHSLTKAPVVGNLSPDGSRWVFLAEIDKRLVVFLVEGDERRKLDSLVLVWSSMVMPFSGNVHWSPDGKMVVAAGSRVTDEGEGVVGWSGFYHAARFSGPGRKPLSKRKVAQVLNGQGFRAYQKCHGEPSCCLDFTAYYVDAVKWDQTYETAIYNAACGMTLSGQRAKAFAYLEKLQALGTKLARKKLSKAPQDKDFETIKNDPRFLELTQ